MTIINNIARPIQFHTSSSKFLNRSTTTASLFAQSRVFLHPLPLDILFRQRRCRNTKAGPVTPYSGLIKNNLALRY